MEAVTESLCKRKVWLRWNHEHSKTFVSKYIYIILKPLCTDNIILYKNNKKTFSIKLKEDVVTSKPQNVCKQDQDGTNTGG